MDLITITVLVQFLLSYLATLKLDETNISLPAFILTFYPGVECKE